MSGILAALHLQQHIGMTTTTFPAAKLLSAQRIDLAIQALAGAANVSHLANENEVSRKFIYEQKTKGRDALQGAFASADADDVVLFSLPVTKEWLHPLYYPSLSSATAPTVAWWNSCATFWASLSARAAYTTCIKSLLGAL